MLLDPESHSFRIIYDVSATTPGAKYYFNTLREGSQHTVNEVIDRMTGKKLSWEIVNGETAREMGLDNADLHTDYLKITLERPVPEGGEVRIRIDKTYKDISSYFQKDNHLVFDRSLGIKRNSIVFPRGYEIVFSNYPIQVEESDSGAVKASFINVTSLEIPLRLEARKLASIDSLSDKVSKDSNLPWPDYPYTPQGRDKSHARLNYNFTERAYQDREIVYFLNQPETHSFSLYHDYTEMREGVDKYLNVVRTGSKASNPSAILLDTGEKLKVETLRGDDIVKKGISLNEEINDSTEVVVIWFDAVKKDESKRIRITETYTDPNRYLIYNGQLLWDRSFGRPDNVVILPKGWYLTENSIPAKIDETEDGKIRLLYINDRPDDIDVYIRGRRK